MKEVWKDIKGYEGLYQVSNLGRVKSLNFHRTGKEQILKSDCQRRGYFYVTLYNNKRGIKKSIHRLVAEAFIPNPHNKPSVDHINTDRTDNRVENLRWATYLENNTNPLTLNKHSGKNSPVAKPIIQFNSNGQFLKKWDFAAKVQHELNICRSTICNCCKGKVKTAGGYKWKYVSDIEILGHLSIAGRLTA